MAVNLSPIWGAGAQLLDNSGNVLSGGKIYTYAAGTTTPVVTYTSSNGLTANSNPIILNSAGRVPYEIWLTDGISYKFVLKDSNDTLIATYDNLSGINSNFVAFTMQQEIQTATAGQTVFTLTTMQYQPGMNTLAVFVDGVNQYGPGAQYAFVETDSTTVTFVSGLHVGASVKFTSAAQVSSNYADASNVSYEPPFTDSVATNVAAKLSQTVSVMDFGAVGDGVTDDTVAIQNALIYSFNNGLDIYFPSAVYGIGDTIIIPQYKEIARPFKGITIEGGNSTLKMLSDVPTFTSGYDNAGTLTTNYGTTLDSYYSQGIKLQNFNIDSSVGALTSAAIQIQDWHQGCVIKNITSPVNDIMLNSKNNYYTVFDTLQSDGAGTDARFNFRDNVNLNKITNCVASNAVIGYKFYSGVTATQFTNNSIEGVEIGIYFAGQVFDIAIENNYAENFTDTLIKFNNYVNSASIKNNYVNFQSLGTNYFLDYLPGPINNIIVEQDNPFILMTDYSQIVKTLDSTAGYNQLTFKMPPGFTGGLFVNNSKLSSQINWQEVNIDSGKKANVVNKYAVGNYSGKFTSGYGQANGFTDTSAGNAMYLTTNISPSDTQLIYVNVKVNVSGSGYAYIKGYFVGTTWVDLASSGGLSPNITVPGSTVQINASLGPSSVATPVIGEVRLI